MIMKIEILILCAMVLTACSSQSENSSITNECDLIQALENVETQSALISKLKNRPYSTSKTMQYTWKDADTRQEVTVLDGKITSRWRTTWGTESKKLASLPEFFTLEEIKAKMGMPHTAKFGDMVYKTTLNQGAYKLQFTVDTKGNVRGHSFYGDSGCAQ